MHCYILARVEVYYGVFICYLILNATMHMEDWNNGLLKDQSFICSAVNACQISSCFWNCQQSSWLSVCGHTRSKTHSLVSVFENISHVLLYHHPHKRTDIKIVLMSVLVSAIGNESVGIVPFLLDVPGSHHRSLATQEESWTLLLLYLSAI
jgi:hypothetical protein